MNKKNSTPVGDALKKTRLGRLKYSRDWSDPTNIKELLDKCSSNSNLSSVLSEIEINIIENFNDSQTYSGLSSTSTATNADEKLSDEENFEQVFPQSKNLSNGHKNIFQNSRKQLQSTVYEEDLIFWKLRWDEELETARENRRRLLQEQFDQHMKSFTNRSTSSKNESFNLQNLSPQTESLPASDDIFQSTVADDEDEYKTCPPAVHSSPNEPLPSVLPLNENQGENHAPPILKLSDDDESAPIPTSQSNKTNLNGASTQRSAEEVLNQKHFDDFATISNVIHQEINIIDQILKENENSTSTLIRQAFEIRSLVDENLKKLSKKVEETKKCDKSTVHSAKEMEKLVSKIIETVENVDLSIPTSLTSIASNDALNSANERREEESTIEIDMTPPVSVVEPSPATVRLEPESETNVDRLPAHLIGTVTTDGYALYCNLMEHLNQIQDSLSRFKNDESLKRYRNQIHKRVLTYLNTIGITNFKENLTELHHFLAGTSDQLIRKHPKALHYCLDLIAERLIKQAEKNVSESNVPVFNAAAVAVALSCEFEEMKSLILAHLFIRCLYLVPFYRPRTADQSEEEYLKMLGYDLDENTTGRGTFLKRVTGMTRFYMAILITPPPPSTYFTQRHGGFNLYPSSTNQQRRTTPFGLRMAWYLLSSIGNLKPITQITAAVLLEVLQTAGFLLNREYKRQFVRLLAYFKNVYMPILKNVHSDMLGLAYNELERLFRTPMFAVPEDFLGEKIWR